MAQPCSMESAPAAMASSTAAGHTAWTATRPPRSCTRATARARPAALQFGVNRRCPSRKSPMIFAHPPLRAASCSAAPASPASSTSRASPGKYPPGGARNRPAVITRGQPGSPASAADASSGEPGSRKASTPSASSRDALARTRSPGSARSPAGLARLRWLWTSTSPGSTQPPASPAAPAGPASTTALKRPSVTSRSTRRPVSISMTRISLPPSASGRQIDTRPPCDRTFDPM